MTCIESGGLEIVQARPVVPTALSATFRITGVSHCVPEVDSLGDARNAPMAVGGIVRNGTARDAPIRSANPPRSGPLPYAPRRGIAGTDRVPRSACTGFARTRHDVVGRSSEDKFRSPAEDVVKDGGWSGIGVPPMQ